MLLYAKSSWVYRDFWQRGILFFYFKFLGKWHQQRFGKQCSAIQVLWRAIQPILRRHHWDAFVLSTNSKCCPGSTRQVHKFRLSIVRLGAYTRNVRGGELGHYGGLDHSGSGPDRSQVREKPCDSLASNVPNNWWISDGFKNLNFKVWSTNELKKIENQNLNFT